MLADNRALAKSWPPTMIVHGDLDAIVPVEHSFHFLSSLVRSDVTIDSGGGGLAAVSAEGQHLPVEISPDILTLFLPAMAYPKYYQLGRMTTRKSRAVMCSPGKIRVKKL